MNSLMMHEIKSITLQPISDSLGEENGSRSIIVTSLNGESLHLTLFGLKKDLTIKVTEEKEI